MPSFDIVSEVNLQEVDNAVNQAVKEITTRYDFRNSKSSITFDKAKKEIHIVADDDYKLKAVIDILQSKAFKRGIAIESLKVGDPQTAAGSLLKCDIKLITGIETEKAKEIVKAIKESKIKVQAQIQDEQVRVSGKKRDDLQETITFVKSQSFGLPLQFNNFRD